MKRDQSFHDYVVGDLLAEIPGITSRAMFGGWGIYRNGKVFAIIADGRLYVKVGDHNRADFEALGSQPFRYQGKTKEITMSYWELPEEIMEDRERTREWVDKATNG